MKYLIMGIGPRGEWKTLPAEEQARRVRHHQGAIARLIAQRGASQRNVLIAAAGLQNESAPITVRNQGSSFAAVDGPFAETKEVLGGFDIIDFDTQDEALEFAAGEHTHDTHKSEVRPIREMWWIQHTTGRAAKTFAIMIYDDETISSKRPPAEAEAIVRQHEGVAAEYLAERGRIPDAPVFWAGARLNWRTTARTMHIAGGKARFTDGPFAETREVVGGIMLVTCDSIDEALHYARKLAPRQGDMVSVTGVGTFWWIYHG